MQKRMILAALAALLLFAPGCITFSTDSTEVGVHVNMLTGLDEEVYPPGGTYFFAPLITDWYTFSTQAQTLKMTADPNDGDRRGKDDVEFKTKDGNDVGVDVTIIYRIISQKAPHILTQVARSDRDLKDRILRPMARSIVRDILNELTSEDIYAGQKFTAADKAQAALTAALEPYGVQCDNVILGDHRFHEAYQEAINNKKINDQKVNTNRSKAENVKREWEAELESAKGQVEQRLAQERGRVEQIKLDADAYYVAAEKTANAQAILAMNEALAGSGGRIMVKRKVAEVLKGKRIVVLPGGGEGSMGLQKMDVNQLLQTYAVTEGAKPTAAAPAK